MGRDERFELEHWSAHNTAAVVDRSAAGRLVMTGDDCLDLLHRLSTQDLLNVPPGHGERTVLTDDRGRIVDLLTVYRMSDKLILLTSAGRQRDVLAWLERYTFGEDSTVLDVSPTTGLLAVLGPQAPDVLRRVTSQPAVADLQRYQHAPTDILGAAVTVARGPEPCDGFQVFLHDRGDLPAVQANLHAAAEKLGGSMAGVAAYEVLRIEAGLGVYGHELGEAHNPLEAQLRDSISFHKGCYVGQEIIARLDTYQKIQKLLVGLLLPAGPVPSSGTGLTVDGRDAGHITSTTFSPTFCRPIALAYVAFKHAVPGTAVRLVGAETSPPAEVVGLPFIVKSRPLAKRPH